jgi:tetratricopeptide (TPR) repeat protein
VALWQARAAQREALRAEGVKTFLTSLLADTNVDKRGVNAGAMTVADLLDAAESRVKNGLAGQPEVRDEVYLLLTELQTAQGRSERAIALAVARVAAAETAFGRDDVRVAPGLVYLAATRINARQDLEQASAGLARAQALLDAARDQRSMTRAQLLMWQGTAQVRELSEGRPIDRTRGTPAFDAVTLLRTHHRSSDDYLIALQMANAFAHWSDRRDETPRYADEALRYADEMLSAVRERYGDSHGLVSRALNARAIALRGMKRFDEAYDTLVQARDHAAKYLGPSHPDIFTFTASMATARFDAGRKDEARALVGEARALVEAHHKDRASIVARLQELEAKVAR